MTMEMVNGIPCFNCTDVEKAKKVGATGSADAQDPLHPSTKIATHKTSGINDVKDSVSISGIGSSDDSNDTSDSNSSSSNQDQSGVNQPLSSGNRGTKINFAA